MMNRERFGRKTADQIRNDSGPNQQEKSKYHGGRHPSPPKQCMADPGRSSCSISIFWDCMFCIHCVAAHGSLLRGERDFRFDRPLLRLRRVLQFWLDNGNIRATQPGHPSYSGLSRAYPAGDTRFSLILGVSDSFSRPEALAISTTSSRTTPLRSFSCAW